MFRHGRGAPLLLVALLGLAIAALRTVDATSSAFSGVTATGGNLASASLTGADAPAGGVASFSANGSSGTCGLAWTALSGGTAVADRFEVTSQPSGAVLTTTAGVGAGSFPVATTQAITSYRLRTRLASTWVSADADSLDTTCVRAGLVSVAAGEVATCAIDTADHLWCWGLGFDQAPGENGYLTRSTPRQEGTATWRQVDMGTAHTCGIRTDGSAWCWGYNWAGQLGAGDTVYRVDPGRVGIANDWQVLATSGNSTCGIRSGGSLWCWGYNQFGQVGDGSTANRLAPVQIGSGTTWVSVSGGKDHSCAVTATGQLWCWGANWNNQVGVAATSPQLVPVRIGTATDWTPSLGLGDFHSCGVKTDSSMWCWGSSWYGELGIASAGNVVSPTEVSKGWAQVDAGRRVTCATKVDGTMWCTGVHADGRTGLGLTSGTTSTFLQVGSADTWRLLTYGARHACGVQDDGTLQCWGNAGAGQTGQGNTGWASPVVVGSATDWVQVAEGDRTTCGRRSGGSLWCWGWNATGQIGQGNANDGYTTPTSIQPGTTWLDVGVSENFVCGIRTDRSLWCWGANWWGQLGTGTYTDSLAPVQVGTATNWESLGVGRGHSCAIKTSGELWCWGANWQGQVGDGTSGNTRGTPVRIGTKTNWKQVSAAGESTCAVDDPGGLWCWGNDAWDKLGNGTAGSQTSPQNVATGAGSVDVGDEHACALSTGGSVYCWGRNDFGAVGDGTTTARNVPTPISSGGTNWRQVTAGHNYSCATRTDDSAYCWGNNVAGQFGIGTVSTQNLNPVFLFGGTAKVEAASGRVHTCGISTGGNLACAGNNAWSQLGYPDLTTTPSTVTGGPWNS